MVVVAKVLVGFLLKKFIFIFSFNILNIFGIGSIQYILLQFKNKEKKIEYEPIFPPQSIILIFLSLK